MNQWKNLIEKCVEYINKLKIIKNLSPLDISNLKKLNTHKAIHSDLIFTLIDIKNSILFINSITIKIFY
jgi:hypothetical protein